MSTRWSPEDAELLAYEYDYIWTNVDSINPR